MQNVTNQADRKFLADELLGGSSEKLSGLLNLTNEELAAQLQHLADTGDFMSRDALDAANEYSQGMDEVKGSLSRVATVIGKRLIKDLNFLIKDIKKVVDGVKQLGRWLGLAEKDTNEFTEAADDMAEVLGDGTAPAIVITTEAAEEAAPAIAKMGDEAETASDKVEVLTSTSRTGAEVIEALRVKSLDAKSAIELMRLEVETADRSILNATETTGQYTDAVAQMNDVLETWRVKQLDARQEADLLTLSMGAARTGFSNVSDEVDPLAALIAEMTQQIQDATASEELQEAALAALPPALRAAAREMGLFGLSAKKTAGEIDAATSAQGRFNQAQADARAAYDNRPPPGQGTDRNTRWVNGRAPRNSRDQGSGKITGVREISGGVLMFSTEHDTNDFNADHFGRRAEAERFLASQDEAPAAQHGAAVRGSRYGSLVRVGENFTNENITPVSRGSGGGNGNSGGRREYPIYIGDEKLTTLVLNAQNELVDTGRA